MVTSAYLVIDDESVACEVLQIAFYFKSVI